MAAETAPAPARQPISLWALAALLCAIVCPILPVLAIVLGVVALFDVRRHNRSGRRMALAALVLGVLASGALGLAAGWWNTHARRPMLQGPVDAIAAGQRGDIAAFRAAFLPRTDPNAEAEAIEFVATLTDRYGRVLGSSQRPDDSEPATTLRHATIVYDFVFDTGPVEAEARFVLSREDVGGLVLRFAWVVVRDPEAGEVRYPPD